MQERAPRGERVGQDQAQLLLVPDLERPGRPCGARRATGYILPGQLSQAGCPKGVLDDWGVGGWAVGDAAPAITFGIREAALARPDGDDIAVSLLRIRGLADRCGFGHRCFLAC